MFDRDEAIDELINNDMNTIQNDDGWYLSSLLRSGFKGYEYMTNDELIEELRARDISHLFGECEDV
jgi:hypothetical protein